MAADGARAQLVSLPSDPTADSIGVALSGGGVRAALFSLGVLVGLVETGQSRNVTNISSVSGGSIVNAAIAQARPFAAYTSTEDFRTMSEPIAENLCRRGAFVFSGSALLALLRRLAPRLGGIAIVGLFAYYAIAQVVKNVDVARSWPWIVAGVGGILVLLLFLSRGALQEALYSAVLASLPGGRRSAQLRDFGRHSDLDTTHVIVATDLISGEPVYFSRDFVCCPAFGWGRPGPTRTASAVYASAAFPVVFPVRRFKRRWFHFQNGSVAPPFPRLLKLNDGGVYNNLGNDWFDHLESRDLWEYGRLSPAPPLRPVAHRIVVNAGAASKGLRRVPPFLAISRTMSVLYDNTVRPRLRTMRERANERLDASIVIDIRESPYDVARRHAGAEIEMYPADERREAEARKARAQRVVKWLSHRPESFWIEFARQTSSTPTKLTRAGLESGARMIFHGYLSAVIQMHVVHGVDLPADVKDEGYFLDLAGRGPAPALHDEPTAAEDVSDLEHDEPVQASTA